MLGSPSQKLGSAAHVGVLKSRYNFGLMDFLTDDLLWNLLPCPFDYYCGCLGKGEYTYVR